MLIKIKSYGIICMYLGKEYTINISKDHESVSEILQMLQKKMKLIDDSAPTLMQGGKPIIKITINGKGADLEEKVKEGDEIALLPLIGGG